MSKLRVKELCKLKGMSMQDIATALHINRVNLSNSLNGNPTLDRLRQVAEVLGVEVSELFQTPRINELSGFVEFSGDIFKINTPEDLFTLTEKVRQALSIEPEKK